MRLTSLLPLVSAAALLLPAVARAQTAPDTSKVRLGWDENYLYASFQIVDKDVRGTNKTPFSNPLEDDSVGLYLRVGKGATAKPDAATHALIVSAAGGGTLLQGGANGEYSVRRAFTMKFGVKVNGTINQSADVDSGYSVELAIPWNLIGVDGKKAGREAFLSACVLTRRRGGALIPFPTGADTSEPSSWPRISLGAETSPLIAGRLQRPPTIDGTISPGEWPLEGAVLPTVDDAPIASVAGSGPLTLTGAFGSLSEPPNLTGRDWSKIGGKVFARYVPFYQADLTRAYPVRGVYGENGSLLLTDQPASGLGPWFSTDRVGWHRGELSAMRRAGIESALVQIGGPDAPTALLDAKTLFTMAAALKEMAQEKQAAPTVAPLFDTAFLSAETVDLGSESGREPLWDAIRRWTELVPAEYRTRVALPGGGFAYPIFLTDGTKLLGNNAPGWADALRRRFAKEFGGQTAGTTLIFVGGRGFEAGENVVGALPLGSGRGRGALPLSVVQPGSQLPLIPRKSGDAYRASWDAAIEADSRWIVLDSWNDYAAASEIAPTRQYGESYVDATRVQTIRALSNRAWGVRIAGTDVPATLSPGTLFPAMVSLQSIGLTPLRGATAPILTYRWEQNGKIVARAPVPIRPGGTLLATQTVPVRLGVATFGSDGKPLAPGTYTLVLEASDPDGKPADTLALPVTVEAGPRTAVEIANSGTTPLLQSGATYPTTLTLRWLGSSALDAGDAQLVCQILSGDGQTLVRSEAIPLDATLEPGRWKTIRASLKTIDASGAPLKPAMPENAPKSRDDEENALGYRVRWSLVKGGAPVPGGLEERVAVYPGDDEVRLSLESLPESGEANAVVPASVTVVNRGPFPWASGSYALAVRWAYADGFTFRRQEEGHVRTPIAPSQLGAAFTKPIAPGESLKVPLDVRLPDRDGRYIAVFTVVRLGGQTPTYLDSGVVSRTEDIAAAVVTVHGGRLVPLDLTKQFDTDGISTEDAPADGDLDGKGDTLPAEWLAPDRFGLNRPLAADPKRTPPPVTYPSGYYSEIASTSARGAGFRYGSTAKGAKNALSAKGLAIPVSRDRYYALHVAALSTEGNAPLTLTFKYADGTTEDRTIKVADWLATETREAIAIGAPRKRTPKGDTAESTAIRHYVVPVAVGKPLASIVLGSAPKVKVFALTLER